MEANDQGKGYYQVNYASGLLAALTSGNVDKRLTAPERVDLIGNARSLQTAGKLPVSDALSLVETFHNDPERQVVTSALEVASAPGAHLVPDNLMPNYQRFIQKNFAARARTLGWVPKDNESDEVKLLRPELLSTVATTGGDKELGSEATQLADKWIADHSAISPSMTVATLGTAAYYGDKSLADKLLIALKGEKDRQVRGRIIRSMGRFRDPAAIETGMNAVLNGQVPLIEGTSLLFAGQGQESTRKLALEFMKAHIEQLTKNRPTGGGFDAFAVFPRVGQSYCDAQSKSELESFFKPLVGQYTGAPRALNQVLESIDVCIAQKQAQEPSMVAFLQKY